ncbi:ISKra4 family transposase [Candidatus Poribacteria bacterium]|nr:ISKra4 family transposase [Candidatus Poribacteria bacterium]
MDILAIIDQEVKEIFSQTDLDTSAPVGDLEREVLEVMRELGRKVLETCLSESAEDASSVSLTCSACEGELRRFRKRQRYVQTLCGVVGVSRWVYHCDACAAYHVPWDSQVGLKEGFTVSVAESMCRLSARLDFREASEELAYHGIQVSHTTLQQKVGRWSAGENVSDYVDEQSLEAGSRWYVSCDGVHTLSQDGSYREVKVGCLYRDYPQLGSKSVASARTQSLRYIASHTDAASFGQQWFDLATASGIYKDETDTEEVVVIGDGAAWIWNLSDEYFPGAVEIVDYMHAKSHLYDVAKQAFGEKADEKVQTWVEETEPFLYAGDTEGVVLRICALGVGNPELSEVLEKEAGYFQRHSKRMRYETFAAKGYHIGSGLIESACKHVVAQRCKQASMKWSQTGINAVLFWRCLLKSSAWDIFWEQQTQNAA